MKPVSKDSSSIADKPAQTATGIASKWELKELFWANHPDDPKDKPKMHYAWAVTGDDLYISPLHEEEHARLIAAAPELLNALQNLVSACLVHPFPNLPVQRPLILAALAISRATLP